ncbi:MAG: sigma-70 family RNA polymerase sigma factor [Crocinitomicaceae bacterium]|nr:sigma-70 family RNA polymerase sigma factor [Crocinitomicaceae bacterium]
MNNSQMTQSEINDSLKDLYKKWPDIKRYLKSKGCTSTDAEDLFQEALLIYSRKLKSPDFELTVEPFHYVKNTCKFLWYNQSRKEGKVQKTEIHENFSETESDWFQKELKLRSIETAISKIGKQCQELLQLFYGLGWSMVDIAKKLGMRNDKVAKAQKYRCISKVKVIIQSDHSENTTL